MMKRAVVGWLAVLGAEALTISKVAQHVAIEANEPQYGSALRKVQKMIREYQKQLIADQDTALEENKKERCQNHNFISENEEIVSEAEATIEELETYQII